MDFGIFVRDMVKLLTHIQKDARFSKQVIKTFSQTLVLIPAFSQLHLLPTEGDQKIHTWVRFCRASSRTFHLKQFIWSECIKGKRRGLPTQNVNGIIWPEDHFR